MSPDVIAAGVFGVAGAVVGLFGERLVRSRGEIWCAIDDWKAYRTAVNVSRTDGVEVQERHLQVTFLNRKDVTVTVWGMRVEFYKGGERLNDEVRPREEFVDDDDRRSPLGPVDLPSRKAVTRTIRVAPVLPGSVTLDPDRLRGV